MSKFDGFYSAIDDIKSLMQRDLIGPIAPNEAIDSVDPLSYYVMGILWARRLDSAAEPTQEDDAKELSLETDIAGEMEEQTEGDDGISSANVYKPSAMGVSVMLPPDTTELDVSFSFGKYVYAERIGLIKSGETEEEKEIKVIQYSRIPYNLRALISVPEVCTSVNPTQRDEFRALGVDVSLTVRKIQQDGSRLVTISVTNTAVAPQVKRQQNEAALFQCELTVLNGKGFIPIYQNQYGLRDEEERHNAMLYRSVLNYAYGHGCSVRYDSCNGKVNTVNSDFMPSALVFQMKTGIISEAEILFLNYWASADRNTACSRLLNFVNEYDEWRKSQAIEAKSLSKYCLPAEKVIERIGICIDRLRTGINELRTNDTAWKAFLFMNEAMLLQRVKTKKLTESQAENVAWYPFQLAYIIQVVPDITNSASAYRNSVDLLWFPTGGGKTEAYLGVAAFTIFYRRLSLAAGVRSDGVAVIMRYTLRLLTIQQFERAAALICSCEYLRRKYVITGGEISIGLWIGSGMTPNHINGVSGAADILEKLHQNPDERINEGNPVQITNCPWCGERIDLDGYNIADNHLVINCNNNVNCEFHSSLPIYLVDDDVYAGKPTLLLSTIDKFARIAWEPNSKALFGDKCAPPELIIQDELHLISGPLGTLAGIYEIAVEYLSTKNSRKPKVIASTATVKNAVEQIRNLYNKPAIQFPPSGIDYDDSFFAVRASGNDRPARTYLGLCELGGSLTDLMIRVYSNLLFSKALLIKKGIADEVIDQFSTIIGYFNALKDLGATDNIIRDRMYANIRTLAEHKFKQECESVGLTLQDIPHVLQDELTSRKSSKEIKETLGKLEVPYPDSSHYSVVLASNMLSVGIDINRLGLMTVYNQPKSNAEYIQATSRVGRQNPGLVLTMFNAARSRDKSHYEQFGYYHQSFYQYVEATSITPCSTRALEKALHCVFIAMLRHTVDYLSSNDCAANFRSDDATVRRVCKYIVSRIAEIRPDAADFAADYLAEVSEQWEALAEENPDTMVYVDHNGGHVGLLQSAEQDSFIDFPRVLNSLRNVEASSNVFIEER